MATGNTPPAWYGGPKYILVKRGSKTARKGGSNSGRKDGRYHASGPKQVPKPTPPFKKRRGHGFIVPRGSW